MTSWEPRLFYTAHGEATMTLDDHLEAHGPLPEFAAGRRRRGSDLIELVQAAGLRGRGGAGFPAAVKLGAVAAARGPSVVVANGSEGEPASGKDALLLATRPHLVLDGTVLCARAVGAPDVVVAVSGGPAARSVERALAERTSGSADGVAITVTRVPDRFMAGEESALLAYLGGGALRPIARPPLPAERGLRRRPTLVANVETLAHIALIARYGAEWFRGVGAADDPGTALVTLSGAVAAPGVFECPSGISLAELIWAAGGVTEPVGAILVGGYFGEWRDRRDVDWLRLSNGSASPGAVRRGAGVVGVLPASACGPSETARVMAYLAGQSAGQCGPCSNGLPAIAATLARVVDGSAGPDAFADLHRWQQVVPGRGACRLPDGAVRFAASALSVFASEFADHARHGRCAACDAHGLLPIPGEDGALAR